MNKVVGLRDVIHVFQCPWLQYIEYIKRLNTNIWVQPLVDASQQQFKSCWEVSIFKDWIRIYLLPQNFLPHPRKKTPKTTPQNQPTGYSKHYLDPQILVGIGNSIQHLWTTCCGTKWNETCSNSFVIHLACWGAWAHDGNAVANLVIIMSCQDVQQS